MPRKPRLEILGYYHIVNEGVEKRIIFKNNEDYEYFIKLLSINLKTYNITLHNYCLMNNHYHLLIQIHKENLSKFMKQLNGSYAIYFNKKYKRIGHLWQGRFKSWYVSDEAYLYTLMLYIEHNPIKARIVKDIKLYSYSSYHYFLNINNMPEFLKDSWIIKNFNFNAKSIIDFFTSSIDTEMLQEIKKISNIVSAPNIDPRLNEKKLIKLKKIFSIDDSKKLRNIKIIKAYQDGYSQHMISKVVGLSQPRVNRIVKVGGVIVIT